MPYADFNVINHPERLEILKKLYLLDTPVEEAFDRLTRLATQIIDAPVALVSLVAADRQFFKSQCGLPEPYATNRQTPLSHSFCQHVVASGQPLIIEDARRHPLVLDNLAIPDLNVIAYLGMPLTTPEGVELGSFCVIDGEPRTWTEQEVEVVRELAHSVMAEIMLRHELEARQHAEKNLQSLNNLLKERNVQLTRVTEICRVTIEHMYDAVQRRAERDELVEYLRQAQTELDRWT